MGKLSNIIIKPLNHIGLIMINIGQYIGIGISPRIPYRMGFMLILCKHKRFKVFQDKVMEMWMMWMNKKV